MDEILHQKMPYSWLRDKPPILWPMFTRGWLFKSSYCVPILTEEAKLSESYLIYSNLINISTLCGEFKFKYDKSPPSTLKPFKQHHCDSTTISFGTHYIQWIIVLSIKAVVGSDF